MPPRKTKVTPNRQIDDSPVVFFLKVSDRNINEILPVGESTSYSDILSVVEKSSERFNTDILKQVLSSVICEKYSPQICCFWCCHTFSWISCVLPIHYDIYNNVYVCEGNFCSPECALAYNYSNPNILDSAKWNRHSLLAHMYAPLYKTRILSPAPPRAILRMFGGPLDIEQFRDYTAGDNEFVLSETHPVRLLFPTMNVQGPVRDIKKYVSLSNDVVEKASEQLRLKRSKPVNVNMPTLDMCIGKK
jgi:hypothetical protein